MMKCCSNWQGWTVTIKLLAGVQNENNTVLGLLLSQHSGIIEMNEATAFSDAALLSVWTQCNSASRLLTSNTYDMTERLVSHLFRGVFEFTGDRKHEYSETWFQGIQKPSGAHLFALPCKQASPQDYLMWSEKKAKGWCNAGERRIWELWSFRTVSQLQLPTPQHLSEGLGIPQNSPWGAQQMCRCCVCINHPLSLITLTTHSVWSVWR